MNRAQATFLVILAILAWFIIYDPSTLIMMILIFGVMIILTLLAISVYYIYEKLGEKG